MYIQHFKQGMVRGLGFAVALLLVFGSFALIADSLNVFNSGEVVSSSKLNANFTTLQTKVAPIGTILAWHKNLTGTPGLSAGWVECSGQTISDTNSVYNGQTLPNLNAALNAWNSRGMFLRGHTTSGIFENDQFQGHRHGSRVWLGNPNAALPVGALQELSTNGSTTDPTIGVHGAPRFGSETRSVNMSVVWIIRIK